VALRCLPRSEENTELEHCANTALELSSESPPFWKSHAHCWMSNAHWLVLRDRVYVH